MNLLPRVAKLTLVAVLCAVQFPAAAWGPESRKAIAQAAYAILQYEINDLAKSGDISYEADLLRGAIDGKGAIQYTLPVNNDKQAIEAIEYQMALLRDVRHEGMGSHFAYRMGVLSAMVADTMQPFGNAWTDDEMRIQDAINSYVERDIYALDASIASHKTTYISNLEQYFRSHRTSFKDDMVMIRDDFKRGIGVDGFVANSVPTYFERSIRAVVDVWFTVMHNRSHTRGFKPSREAVTNYFVDEIGYLLNVRQNLEYANRAYEVYKRVNPGIVQSHLNVGDLYYGFGTREAKETAVEEWKKVQRMSGKYRKEASRRLSDHYIAEGEAYIAHSTTPERYESDLPDALRAFQSALEFDRTNALAARKISETSEAIKKRREEYTLQQKYIDGAALAIQRAEEAQTNGNYATSIGAYTQALSLLELVDDQFRDLQESSEEQISDVKRARKQVVREVIDRANEAIEAGDTALLSTDYDAAIRAYNSVETLVSDIPEAVMSSVDKTTVEGLRTTAANGINDAELGKSRNAQPSTPQPGVQL